MSEADLSIRFHAAFLEKGPIAVAEARRLKAKYAAAVYDKPKIIWDGRCWYLASVERYGDIVAPTIARLSAFVALEAACRQMESPI